MYAVARGSIELIRYFYEVMQININHLMPENNGKDAVPFCLEISLYHRGKDVLLYLLNKAQKLWRMKDILNLISSLKQLPLDKQDSLLEIILTSSAFERAYHGLKTNHE